MDNELLLQIGSALGTATALLTWPKLYAQAVSTRLKTRGLRTKRWNRLVEKGAWKTVVPIILEDAFADAYGYSLSDRDIRFSIGRSNSRALFRDLRQCKGMVRLRPDASGFDAVKPRTRLSFRKTSIAVFAMGYVPLGALFVFAPFVASRTTAREQVLLLIATFFGMVMSLVVAGWLEAAHRVVEELETRYPVFGDAGLLANGTSPPCTPGVALSAANDGG